MTLMTPNWPLLVAQALEAAALLLAVEVALRRSRQSARGGTLQAWPCACEATFLERLFTSSAAASTNDTLHMPSRDRDLCRCPQTCRSCCYRAWSSCAAARTLRAPA